MNYYSHHIGDYRRDTVHLSMLEHGAYRQLIDWYYLEETPIPKKTEVVFRRLCARTEDEKTAIQTVLNEFFNDTENGWVHARCDREIRDYQGKADRARNNGKLGGRPKKTKEVIYGLSEETEQEPKQKLTNNHKPITNNHIKTNRGSRLPTDWIAPQEFIDYCNKERPDLDARSIADGFKDYWISVAGSKGVKADWFATWRVWVRRQEQAKSKFKNKSAIITDSQFDDWLNSGERNLVAING